MTMLEQRSNFFTATLTHISFLLLKNKSKCGY
jgi:hypothetical protein